MKSYYSAIDCAVEDSLNMPDFEVNPAEFIKWAEDICQLLASIYERDYDEVTNDLMEQVNPEGE